MPDRDDDKGIKNPSANVFIIKLNALPLFLNKLRHFVHKARKLPTSQMIIIVFAHFAIFHDNKNYEQTMKKLNYFNAKVKVLYFVE